MTIILDGEYTTAEILVDDESLIEENCIEQIRELVNHPAFTKPIRIMPDAHWGAGAPVGFTMELPDKIVPNIVGVDVGCGMTATNIGDELPLDAPIRDRCIREAVPMGREVHDYNESQHLIKQFPFRRANAVFSRFAAAYQDRFGYEIDPLEYEFNGYDGEYFKELCRRVLSQQRRGIGHVIRSAGTLGGGNHFIEFAQARESGDYWVVVHSGSRYLGKSVAEFWQHKACQYRSADAIRDAIPAKYTEFLKFDPYQVSDHDLYEWVTGGKGESHLRKERIRETFDGKKVEEVFNILSQPEESLRARNENLDWLNGKEAHGYYVDMLFAQQYARWNRDLITEAICDVLGVEPMDQIESVHNYIDFEDMTIRKGATPAREGQRLIIPFNMAEGSMLARGKGTDAWNHSAPHGAGRIIGRSDAHEQFSVEDFKKAMSGVYSESIVESVVDEAPMAYKSTESIANAIESTAEIIDWLDVVHNLKATK